MPSQELRPNSTINTAASVTGAASEHAATNDDSDASYASLTGLNFLFYCGATSFTLPADNVVTQVRARARARSSGSDDIYLELYDNGSQLIQTDVGSLSGSFAAKSGGWLEQALTQTQINNLQVGASLVTGGVADVSELYIDVDYAAPPSAPTVTAPSGTKTIRNPLVEWSFNGGSGGPSTQRKYLVRIFDSATYGAGGFDPTDNTFILSSGKVWSADTQWTPTTDLPNGDTYRAYVKTYVIVNGVEMESPYAYSQFTIDIPLSIPTNLSPTAGSTKTSSTPSIGADIAAQTDGVKIKRRWQVASDTGFTADVQTYTDSTAQSTKSGTISFPGTWTRLAQGTWYIRCRAVDEYGVTGSYTSYNTFYVAHAPSSTSRLPGSGLSYEYVPDEVDVSWTFSDPDNNDFQSAFEVELWKLSDPGSPIQPGKITGAPGLLKTYTITGLDSSWKDTELRWRLKVYDQDDVASAWSVDQGFFLREIPVPNITDPVGALGATSAQPDITWTFYSANGATQVNARVVVEDTDASQVVFDSGVRTGTGTTLSMSSPVIAISTNYQTTLTVTDSHGLVGEDVDTFTATYTLPTTPSFSLNASNYDNDSAVIVDWSSATQDGTCLGWHVYRRNSGDVVWNLIHVGEPDDDSWIDYTCPSNIVVEYSVVQVAESFGDPVESSYPIEIITPQTNHYFLTCQDQPSLNLKLYNVNSDTFEDEQEMAELNLVDRGRQVSYGTRFGQRGTFSAQLWDRVGFTARAQRTAIEQIRDAGLTVHFKNPFGDSWAVALSSARIVRVAGVGLHEAASLTVDYIEITG